MVLVAVWWSLWRERNNKVFENTVEPSFQVYKKAKFLLLFWDRKCKDCDNDSRGGLLRDWSHSIGLM